MITTNGVEQHKQGVCAREYLRVSMDRSGRARSLDEQHGDHVRVVGEQGWTLAGESYWDESVSASRYSRKARGGFDALVEDLKHDRFGAQVLMIWESSRGSRRVGDPDPVRAGVDGAGAALDGADALCGVALAHPRKPSGECAD